MYIKPINVPIPVAPKRPKGININSICFWVNFLLLLLLLMFNGLSKSSIGSNNLFKLDIVAKALLLDTLGIDLIVKTDSIDSLLLVASFLTTAFNSFRSIS